MDAIHPHRALLAALLCAAFAAPAASAAQTPDSTRRSVALEELVVTASGFEQDRTSAPASITVVSGEELTRKRGNGLSEILAELEGIDIGGTRGKTGGLNVSLRGMPSDYTLVLIDGKRQNSAGNVTPNGFGETSTSFLPPLASIERVEIIRGPMSTLYGSDAMGGVVNIITRKVADRWRGSVTSDATVQEEAGFGNSYAGNGTIGGPVVPGRVGVMVRGSVLHRRASELSPTGEFGGSTAISRRGASPVQADVWSAGARLAVTPGRGHDLWIDADAARQSYDNSEAQLGTLDRPDASPPTFNGYGPELRFNRDQLSATHRWTSASARLETSLMRNYTETIGRTLPAGTPGGPPGSGAPNKPVGSPRALETENLVLDSKLTSGLGRHTVSVGGQLWDARMIDGVALEPFEQTQRSLFAEDEWRLVDDLALTLGVRRDDHSTFGGQVSPRAYLVWSATPAWTFKGGVGRGYKTPRVEQLQDGIIGFTGQGRIASIGTPTLKPETSTSIEAGAHYGGPWGARASVTLFHNRFSDKITRGTPVPNCSFALAPDRQGCLDYGDFPSQESFSQSVNVDEAITRGLEASASVPLGEFVELSGNYTFTDSDQRSGENEGMPLTDTPRHMVNGSLRAEPTERLSGWLRGEYRSERARRTTVAEDPAFDALGDYRAYSLVHLGGGYRVSQAVTVNVTVYNLLNRDFLRFGAYRDEPSADNPTGVMYTSLYNNHEEGRRLWLSTSIQF